MNPTDIQQKQFLLANLLQDISIYINLRENNLEEENEQVKNVLLKIGDVISDLILLDTIPEETKKALASLYEYIQRNESLERKDFDTYIYPLIIKLQAIN
jgi:hypothetical protein